MLTEIGGAPKMNQIRTVQHDDLLVYLDDERTINMAKMVRIQPENKNKPEWIKSQDKQHEAGQHRSCAEAQGRQTK